MTETKCALCGVLIKKNNEGDNLCFNKYFDYVDGRIKEDNAVVWDEHSAMDVVSRLEEFASCWLKY